MKVLLVFPPQFEPTQPYSSIPCLTANLRSHGIETIQRDLNIESFHHILRPEFLGSCLKKLESKIRKFESHTALPLIDQDNYLKSLKAVASSSYICDNISEAISNIQRLDTFRNYKIYKDSICIIKEALQIISAAYYPSFVGLYKTRIGWNQDSSEDAMSAAVDNILNPYYDWFENDIIKQIEEMNPGLTGISIATHDQFVPALSLAYLIKRNLPDTYVVFGGPYITRIISYLSNPKHFFSFVDGVIVGEGESPLLELVHHLESGEDVLDVHNLISYRDGVLIRGNLFREVFKDLPLPDFSGLTIDSYLSPVFVLPFSTSRGCHYAKCTFCCHFYPVNVYKEINPEIAYQSIRELVKIYKTNYFSFSDNSIPAKWMKQFAESIVLGKDNITWYTFARLEEGFDENAIQTIVSGGCKMLMFGFESANEHVLYLMNKGTEVNLAKEVLEKCAESKIAIRLGMLVGFPGETFLESESTLNFLKENLTMLDQPFFVPPISRFKLLRDSIVDQNPEKFGVKILPHPDDEDLEREQHYLSEGGMTMAEAEMQYRRFVDYFTKSFNAYKQMPDNKSHSYLYKCFNDAEIILRDLDSQQEESASNFIDLVKHLPEAIKIFPHVLLIDACFDLDILSGNIEWLNNECVFGRLRAHKSYYNVWKDITYSDVERLINRSDRKYIFNVLTQQAFEIGEEAYLILCNYNKFKTCEDFQAHFLMQYDSLLQEGTLRDFFSSLVEGKLIYME